MQIDCVFPLVHMFNDRVCEFWIWNICHSDHTCYKINTGKYMLPLKWHSHGHEYIHTCGFFLGDIPVV